MSAKQVEIVVGEREARFSFRSTSSRSPRTMPARRRTARRRSRPMRPASPPRAFCRTLSSSRNWTRTGLPPGFISSPSAKAGDWRSCLRVKRKEIKKTEPIRCIIDTANDPHEISLDENVTRENMHPADQFEAFKKLAEERGYGAEEIAARFGVTPHVVRQRLRLGAVSPRLMQIYRDGDLALDQLMAFAIIEDHARQEAAYERLSYNRDASTIRRLLTETNVAATDRRAVFVGAEKYTEVGRHHPARPLHRGSRRLFRGRGAARHAGLGQAWPRSRRRDGSRGLEMGAGLPRLPA